MPDLNFQDFSTVQNLGQPKPATMASTTTMAAPTGFLTFISGTVAIATVTPPVTGAHMLCFVFTTTTPVAFTTAGNIAKIVTPTLNSPVYLVYDPLTAKYYAGNSPA